MKRALISAVSVASVFAACAQAYAAVGTAPAEASIVGVASVNLSQSLVMAPITTAALTQSLTPSALTTGMLPTSAMSQGQIQGPVASAPTVTNSGTNGSPAALASNRVSNAALTIYGQSGDTVSMQVPASFQVTRTGGTEALTMTTNTNVEVGMGGAGTVLGGSVVGGSIVGGDTMSVNVGAALQVAAAGGPLVPGPYEGVLVLVVQYN